MQRCLLRSQHRQVKGSLRACMGKGSFSSCRKHTFTSAFLSENPFGLPAIRLGCGRFISLKSANFSAEATASWLTACSQEFHRERVDQHTAACPEYQTANSRADSGSLLQPAPLAPAPPSKSPFSPSIVAFLEGGFSATTFPGGRKTSAIQRYISKTFSMTTQGLEETASLEQPENCPGGRMAESRHPLSQGC